MAEKMNEERGNHFGCTGEGQASVGVFGMMSSIVLAVQLIINIINSSNNNNNNNNDRNDNNNNNNLNDNSQVMIMAPAPMNTNIAVGRKVSKTLNSETNYTN